MPNGPTCVRQHVSISRQSNHSRCALSPTPWLDIDHSGSVFPQQRTESGVLAVGDRERMSEAHAFGRQSTDLSAFGVGGHLEQAHVPRVLHPPCHADRRRAHVRFAVGHRKVDRSRSPRHRSISLVGPSIDEPDDLTWRSSMPAWSLPIGCISTALVVGLLAAVWSRECGAAHGTQ